MVTRARFSLAATLVAMAAGCGSPAPICITRVP